MASGPHTFTTMSVFSPTRFEGARVTVISVRGPVDLPPLFSPRRSRIAAEFGYDTCVFLYDAVAANQTRRLQIYVLAGGGQGQDAGVWGKTRGWVEVEFDVGGILAAAHYIFNNIEKRSHFAQGGERDNQRQTTAFTVLKSGLQVPCFYNPYRQVAACAVPDIAKLLKLDGGTVRWAKVLDTQPQLKIVPGVEKMEQKECPVIRLGGREWVLIDVSEAEDMIKSVEAKGLEVEGKRVSICWMVRKVPERGKDGEPVIENLTCRVTGWGWEEEGGANAATAAAAWLSLKENDDLAGKIEALKVTEAERKETAERKVFGVQTGVELGRPGTIAVEVDLKIGSDGKRRIESLIISGRANFTTRGEVVGT